MADRGGGDPLGITRIMLIRAIPKGSDLETHVRRIEVDGQSFVELRDYVPSLGEYRRGYWFPDSGDFLTGVVAALVGAAAGGSATGTGG